MARLPLVAIVGRPNVGKSTLFNRMVGRKQALVDDRPGLTRDRNYGDADWRTRAFKLVDTGGWEARDLPTSVVSGDMREQASLAIDEADLTIFVVNVRTPDNPLDAEVIDLLRKRNTPFLLAVNRCDNPEIAIDASEFYSVGVEELFPISAINGLGTGELLDAVIERLPEAGIGEDDDDDTIHVAVVGRPNVGKSTIINQILGEERLIASATPGTTRDAIDTRVRRDGQDYLFVDTAGIRRRGSIERGVEKMCVAASVLGMERCDVALLLIDGGEGVTDQDAHIAGYAADAGCALVIVVNKWDAVEKDTNTSGKMAIKIREQMAFASYAPIIFVSAMSGQRVPKIFPLIDAVAEQHRRRITTSDLNRTLERSVNHKPPPVRKNRPLKIKYGVQVASKPPRFTIHVNDADLMHFSYRRYLINQIRREYGFEGTPIVLALKSTKREKPG